MPLGIFQNIIFNPEVKMNKLLHIVFVSALLAVIYSEVSARSYISLPRVHKAPVGIVNGTDAAEGELPYMVQLRDSFKDYLCSGAIIGDKWILTAGHCFAIPIDSIVYGTNNLDQIGETVNVIKVKEMHLHPKYSFNSTEIGLIPLYDIAILELAEAIPFSNKAQPLKLADSSVNVPFGVDGVLAGWGLNDTYGSVEPYLQKIDLKLLTDIECARKIAEYNGHDVFNGVHNLCSDDFWRGQCSGDSGSPFVINGTQYGIVSWSIKPCGSFPGTYSRITNPEYRDFIKNVTSI